MRLLSLIAVCLWLAFSGYWYTCKVRCACNDGFALFAAAPMLAGSDKQETVSISSKKDKTPSVSKDNSREQVEPVLFECNEFVALQGREFKNLVEDLKRKAEVMDSLHVKGYYSTKELNRSKFADLGLARANAIREILKGEVGEIGITIDSEERLEMGIKCDRPFSATGFTWQ